MRGAARVDTKSEPARENPCHVAHATASFSGVQDASRHLLAHRRARRPPRACGYDGEASDGHVPCEILSAMQMGGSHSDAAAPSARRGARNVRCLKSRVRAGAAQEVARGGTARTSATRGGA
jgi:hypothetical protein